MFYIDNKSSKELGIVAKEEDFIIRAPINFEEVLVAGKDGNDFRENGYLNVTGTLEIFIYNENKIDSIISCFTGKHELIVNDRKATVFFYDALPITRYGTIKSMRVQYIRKPFWHSKTNTKERGITSIQNNGNVYAKPLIELTGDGTVNITINTVPFSYTFDADKTVYIDCEEKEEQYNGKSKSKNLKIGFDYPILYPGINKIKIEGNAKMYFYRKDRWI